MLFIFFVVLSCVSLHAQSTSDNHDPSSELSIDPKPSFMNVWVVPDKDLIVMQFKNLNTDNYTIQLADTSGKIIQSTILYQGSTLAYFDTQTLYAGHYLLQIPNANQLLTYHITLNK
jgi:hypothetical protein